MAFSIYEKRVYANAERLKNSVVAAVKAFYNMPLEKKERVLLVKLIYQNDNNLSTVLREYRGLKGLRKERISK